MPPPPRASSGWIPDLAQPGAAKYLRRVSRDDSAGRSRPGILGALRQAVSGGTAFGGRSTVPEGRAERLGLAVVPPGASSALGLPMEFLGLGQDRTAGAELAGRIGGLGARVFEFNAGEMAGSRGDAAGGWDSFAYRVAAVELGYGLPWFAIALRRVPSPAQRIYPGRRSHGLDTGDRKTDRAYVLYADDPAAVAAVLGGPLRSWLPGALATRPEQRPLITLEVSGGWAMTAIQAGGLAVPDMVALSRQQRLGHPGPWPDALLSLLAGFREHAAPGARRPGA